MKSYHWKTQAFLLCTVGLLFLSLRCSDPLSEEQKETLVRKLVNGEQVATGNYSIFWDGRDDKDKRLPAGTYVCNFWTKDYGQQITMTALAGGSTDAAESNDSTDYDYNPLPLHFNLDQNSPDPFHINEGTNIRFAVPDPAEILITIHREE